MAAADASQKQHIFFTWPEIVADAEKLCLQLEKSTPFTGILGVSTGGLPLACLVGRCLSLRNIETVCVVSYDGQTQQNDVRMLKQPDLPDGGRGWLVIDDLVDSGRTYAHLRRLYPNATFACLYAKPAGRLHTDFYVKEFSQESWLFFPWEIDDLAVLAKKEAEKA